MSQESSGKDGRGADSERRPPKRRRSGSGGGGSGFQGFRLAIASGCVGVWAADNVRGIIDATYQPHVALALPLAAAAFIFGTVIWPNKKDDDE